MPTVSVVIPLYQTEAFIAAAIHSVLRQTFADFEVIVVDDGSRDRGPEIVRAVADPRVRVIRQENRGLAGARNTGIRHAAGELVALLDADDLWAPQKLATHVEHLANATDVDISFSASRLIDENSDDVGLTQSPLTDGLDASEFFCRNPIGNGSAPVLRRRALDRIAFPHPTRGDACWFDESFRQSEDVECWMRLVAAGCRFGYVPEALTYYRVNTGGLSANIDAQLATWRRFRDKVAGYAPEIVARYGARAEAYQLRYLARRAVRSDDRRAAAALVSRAMWLHPMMLFEEPLRTFATIGAAVFKLVLPQRLYSDLERRALTYASGSPGARF